MKTVLTLIFVAITGSFMVNAQPPTYDDLLILFADEDYSKLLKKAERYTQKDDTKRDAIPYIFMSRANFEISKDAELMEDYPKAFKDAVKYAAKGLRKDREGIVYEEFRDYFSDLKKVLVEELENFLIEQEYKRAENTLKQIQFLDEDDIGANFMMAYVKNMNGDISGAREYLINGNKKLDETTDLTGYRTEDLRLLKLGLMNYAMYAHEKGYTDEAKKIINKGYQWFENEPEYVKAYDEIVN